MTSHSQTIHKPAQTGHTIAHRTLILTSGPLAHDVGRGAMTRLTASPGLAAITTLVQAEDLAQDAILATQIASVATVEAAEAATAAGLRLDRSRDLHLLLIVDDAAETGVHLTEQIRAVRTQARRLLLGGVETRLLLLLSESANHAFLRDLGLLDETTANTFDQGVFLLSMTNTLGRRLASTDALIARATTFVWALLATSIGEALPHNRLGYEPGAFTAVGVAQWGWSPALFRQACLRTALRQTLAAWRICPTPTATTDAAINTWLTNQDADPGALMRQLTAALSAQPHLPLLRWRFPAPWQLSTYFAPLIVEPTASHSNVDNNTIRALVTKLRTALDTTVDHHLKAADEGVIPNLGGWLTLLNNSLHQHLAQLEEQKAGRQLIREDLDRQHNAERDAAVDMLDDWPANTRLAWLVCGLRPWRWPRLVRTYLSLRTLGRALTHTVRQQRRLAQDSAVFDAAATVYQALTITVQRWRDRLDELDMMLAAMHQAVPEPDLDGMLLIDGHPYPVSPATFSHLYAGVVPDTADHRRASAAALSTLSTQARQPDDARFGQLQAHLTTTIDAAPQPALADLIALELPSVNERTQWWNQLWERAAPLWRASLEPLTETQRGATTRWGAVLSSDGPTLAPQARESHRLNWLRGPEHAVVIVRLEINLPFDTLNPWPDSSKEQSE